MQVFQQEIALRSKGHGDMQDITDAVQEVVEASGIDQGVAHVQVIGSTAAIVTIEFEPGLRQDLPELLDRLIPPGRHYKHEQTWHDGNGHSHLQATLLGAMYSAPVQYGRLVLGTWQQITFVECDIRPRDRRIFVTVMGEVSAE